MSERSELRLEVAPGVVRAAWLPLPPSGKAAGKQLDKEQPNLFSLNVPVWQAGRKQEVVRCLALSPAEVYALLQGRLTGGLAALDLLPTDAELREGTADKGHKDDGETAKLVRTRLAEEPMLALSLRGFGKGELLEGIFALWAEPEDEAAEAEGGNPATVGTGVLAAELARLERKGPAVSSGEWLAEAAAEGSLHQPGPQFHEIAARPFPASPVVAPVSEGWEELLPNTPKARQGLTLIVQRVAQAAARRAGKEGKPQR
ncbi:hypothetical protein [Paenibacillus donghaensis]|uniref:Uncharacterized protein n=1 Tax=Paenibacillus donghaensis TaxID=414771 RepID=A0A2Z2KTZ0_9BACL|nr:hypothetical protein [Paenibacillus donghaensis]ASA25462.1 hypothetical protein B9T62_34870 [Paenibacillus donghaensis]